MKYVLTTQTINPQGQRYFNPVIDVEVFDTYYSALRALVQEILGLVKCGYYPVRFPFKYRSQLGRECLYHIECNRNDFKYIYDICRIPENGLH